MAYRKLVTGDRVKITNMSDCHGAEGMVLAGAVNGARVEYYNRQLSTYVVGWFEATDLVITVDSSQYKAPIKEEIKMTQFKVGDVVRVINCRLFHAMNIGSIGTITHMEPSPFSLNQVTVRFEDGGSDYGYCSDLELVGQVPTFRAADIQTTLAEKLDALDKLTAEIRAMVGLTPSGSAL